MAARIGSPARRTTCLSGHPSAIRISCAEPCGRTGALLRNRKAGNIALAWTRVFSPQWLKRGFGSDSAGLSASALKEGAFEEDIAGSLFRGTDSAPVTFGAPAIGLSDYSGVGSTGNGPLNYLTNSWSVVNAVSYTTGKHKIKAGIDFRNFLFKEVNSYRPRGHIGFTGLFTQNPENATGQLRGRLCSGLAVLSRCQSGRILKLVPCAGV